MTDKIDKRYIEECEMHIVGHKIFVRLKDIPMYLSKKTKDSIRNRYSHSVEVGLSTEYLLSHVSRELGDEINLNFFHIGKIIGMVHDIGHTAFSHDGETILDKMLQKASSSHKRPIRFNANINNFRRIEKYGLLNLLPPDIHRYALASLVKRKKELRQYPEYSNLTDDVNDAIKLEETYLSSHGIPIQNHTNKTILCQAMDLADENRYRVTDIIDSLNIYSKEKLREILIRSIRSDVRIKDIRKVVSLKAGDSVETHHAHSDKMKIKDLLIFLLEQESNAKTEFQNVMNSLSMAFNRNFTLNKRGKLVPINLDIETLREDFQKIAATYIWGAKKIKKIKQPYKHYFSTVVNYFINKRYDIDFIDSVSYKKALIILNETTVNKEDKRRKELLLLRNFLGGLTNLKIIELYKKIKVLDFENKFSYTINKKEKLIQNTPINTFEKKLEKYSKKIVKKRNKPL